MIPRARREASDTCPIFSTFTEEAGRSLALFPLLCACSRTKLARRKHAARSLTEVLLIQVLRMLWNRSHTPATGWWQALRDPAIAAALAAIHDKPGHTWSLESLAAKAGLSRSVFAARFRE